MNCEINKKNCNVKFSIVLTASTSAASLLEGMKEDGFKLKQSILGRMAEDPSAEHEVYLILIIVLNYKVKLSFDYSAKLEILITHILGFSHGG